MGRQEGFDRLSNSNPHYSVTFCITELDVGGAEKALVRIAIGLQDLGWTVRVISLRDAGPMTGKLEEAGIPVTALNCGSFADVRTYFRLKAEIKNNRPDVLVSFLHQANIYGRLVASRLKLPVVSGVRVADRRKFIAWTERLTKSCVTHYIAVSEHVAKTHASLCRIADNRISAITNGVDIIGVKDSVATSESTDHRFQLLFVGRLTRQKDPLTLLNAFDALPTELKAVSSLNYAGEGELRGDLEARITELGLSERVKLLGQCQNPTQLMTQSTLLVLPSLWEGMPNVVLEAMAAGLPIVATDVDGTRELITDQINGWLVPPSDFGRLCDAIRNALENEGQRSEFAKTSQVIAAERFSWNRIFGEYHERLTSIVVDSASR